MYAFFAEIQREIYASLATQIKLFSSSGDWIEFGSFLPLGVVFGLVHAITPGHSKALLATYVTGSGLSSVKALSVSLMLSATHISMSVIIVLFSLPIVQIMFGGSGPGSSPILENLSRGLLGLIGLWFLLSALTRKTHDHHHGQGLAFGLTAGLIPCPLTLFVMTFAATQGVIAAGLFFAATMFIGVAITLSATALLVVLFRNRMENLLSSKPNFLATIARAAEILTGIVLIWVAVLQFS